MHDVWFVFLPPNVDTCITGRVCGSFAFAGYHALSNVGERGVIYAVAVDPVIGSSNEVTLTGPMFPAS